MSLNTQMVKRTNIFWYLVYPKDPHRHSIKLNNQPHMAPDTGFLAWGYVDQIHKQKNKTTDQNKSEQAGFSVL